MSVLTTRRTREFAELRAAGWAVERYRPVWRSGLRRTLPLGRWSQ